MDTDVIDGTRPLPSLGEAIVKTARELQESPQVEKSNSTAERIIEAVRILGSEKQPATIAALRRKFPDLNNSQISAALSGASLRERHLHRRKIDTGQQDSRGHKVTGFGYWFNEAYPNPLYGQRRIARKEKPTKTKKIRKPTIKNVVVTPPATPTILKDTGSVLLITVKGELEHTFSLKDAQLVYEQLNHLFSLK